MPACAMSFLKVRDPSWEPEYRAGLHGFLARVPGDLMHCLDCPDP